MKQNRQSLLHLSLISGIGPATVCKIIAYLLHDQVGHIPAQACDIIRDKIDQLDTLSFEQIYNFTSADFRQKIGLSEKVAQTLVQGLADKKLLEEEVQLIEKYTIHIDTLLDPEYPILLRNISQPPLLLYSKGATLFDKTSKRLAFVGSRKADKYSSQVIDHLIPGLVHNGWEIVSGGALGVDSMAHKSTLEAGGKTIVVLGSGLLRPYPEQNKKFFKKIVENGGTLVSSFALRTTPDRTTFPARNRIIAGLSQGCVIVQAAQKSGALITAEFALEQGKQVFAIPGSIFNDLSGGCHKLLDQGAKLVKDISDILSEFGEHDCLGGSTHRDFEEAKHVSTLQECNKTHELRVSKNSAISHDTGARVAVLADPFLVHFDGMHTLDELSTKSGLSFAELQDKLFCLQLDGLVKQNFAGSWEKIDTNL